MEFSKYILDNFFSSVTLFGTPEFYILIVLLLIKINPSFAIKLIIALLVTEAVCGIIKFAYPKERPIPRSNKKFFERYDAGSFPSIHTARITTLAVMINSFYNDNLLLFVSIALILCVGYSRVYLKHHYFKDVVGGLAIGIIISILVILK